MKDNTSEALDIMAQMKPYILDWINNATSNCVRSKKMNVTVAPDGTTIGVAEEYGNTIQIPYVSTLSGATVGTSVRVEWYYNSASTSIAVSYGDGK